MFWAEPKVVNVKLSVHALRSEIVSLGPIFACAVEGTLLFVSPDEAAKKRYALPEARSEAVLWLYSAP
jgi:hypothetical protein